MSNESKRILELTNRIAHLEQSIGNILCVLAEMSAAMKADGELMRHQITFNDLIAKTVSRNQ